MAVDIKKVLREKPGTFLAYFLPLLVMAEDNVELIDVLELFGMDRLCEAMERLGGSRVIFPTWASIDSLVRDAYLVARLDSQLGRANAEARARLEAEFDAPYDFLLFRYRAVKDLIRRAGSLSAEPMPGAEEAAQYFQRVKRLNGRMKRAVKNEMGTP